MRKVSYALILLLAISCFSPLFLSTNVAALPGDMVVPGTAMTGTVNEDNPSDYYGIDITQVGYYNFSLSVAGDEVASAQFKCFSSGYPSTMAWIAADEWQSVYIGPGLTASSVNGLFQIEVYTNLVNDAPYTVRFELIGNIDTITPDDPYDIILKSGAPRMIIFDASSSEQCYNFTYLADGSSSVYWTIYNNEGLSVTAGTFYDDSFALVLLKDGRYYLTMSTSSMTDLTIDIVFVTHSIETVRPSDSVAVNVDSAQMYSFYQLSLVEGMEYNIELTAVAGADIGFVIFKGPSTNSPMNAFDSFGTGLGENVTDYVLFGQYSAYTEWDYDESMNLVRHYAYWSSSYEGFALDHSRMIIGIIYFSGNGASTLSISSGTPVDTIAIGGSQSTSFDNYDGDLWKLYRVTGGFPMRMCTVDIDHTGIGGSDLSTNYDFYLPYSNSYSYVQYTRPFISEQSRIMYENLVTLSFSNNWNNYEPNTEQNKYFFQVTADYAWLMIEVPDGVMGGYETGVGLLEGTVDITITEVPPIPLGVNAPVQFDPDPDPDIPVYYTATLLGGHYYRFEFTAENQASEGYQAYAINTTGHTLQALPLGYYGSNPYIGDFDTSRSDFFVTNIMDVAIIVSGRGDALVTFMLVDLFPGVDTIFVIIGIVGAAAGGIVIGLLVGKSKFGAPI